MQKEITMRTGVTTLVSNACMRKKIRKILSPNFFIFSIFFLEKMTVPRVIKGKKSRTNTLNETSATRINESPLSFLYHNYPS